MTWHPHDRNAAARLPVHTTRADVKRRAVRTSRELLAFALSSYGPCGLATLLQKSTRCADALVLTSTSDRFFQHIDVGDCPIANVYYQMLRSHLRRHSDAGLFLTILSASLQLEIQEGALAELPRQSVLRGLELAREWSLRYLDDDACPVRLPVDWSQRATIHAIIRGVVSTSAAADRASDAVQDTLVPLVLDTFLALYASIAQHPNEAMPVRFVRDPGRTSLAKSQLWRDSVLLDFAWPHGCPATPRTNVALALFNITIDPLRDDTSDATATIEHSAGSQTTFRLAALRRIGDALEELGVTAVMSQKLIPRYLQTYLRSKGMFVLDRLSIHHIHAVHQLSGALVLGDWDVTSVDASVLGFLSLVTTLEVSGKQFIRLHRDRAQSFDSAAEPACASVSMARSRPVATLVLATLDTLAFDELTYAIETALKRLAALSEAPDALAGAGCAELHLAVFLQQHAALLQCLPGASADERRGVRQLRQVIETFATCLLRVVAALGGEANAHAPSAETSLLTALREANSRTLEAHARDSDHPSATVTLFGWDPVERCVSPVTTYTHASDGSSECDNRTVLHAHVLDALGAKRDALVLALECVSTIARIASVVRTS